MPSYLCDSLPDQSDICVVKLPCVSRKLCFVLICCGCSRLINRSWKNVDGSDGDPSDRCTNPANRDISAAKHVI